MFIPTLPFGKYKQMAESKRDNKWKQIRRGGEQMVKVVQSIQIML